MGDQSGHHTRKLPYAQDIDFQIKQWIMEQRDLHLSVTPDCIMDHAQSCVQPHHPTFQITRGWLEKFMTRHNLSLRAKTSTSQKLPADLEHKIDSFMEYVRETREEKEYEDKFIINMDKTPLYRKMRW